MRIASTLPKIAAAVLVLSCLAMDATAAVRISGNAEWVVLEVESASLGEVLAALRQVLPLNISVRGTTPQTFSGTYSGSVRRVLVRLLSSDNHDFFLAVRPGVLQLTLLDRKPGGSVSVVSAVSGLRDANDSSLMALAAATAHGGGSRDSRVRQQRLLRPLGSADPY
jgi:hypothetical protein